MVDFIIKLPLVARKDVILVVYNRLSKMTYFVTTTKGSLVEELARIFKNNMWKLHRLSESVVLNRRPQFVVELTKELNSMLGIMIVMIYTSCFTGICLMLDMYWGLSYI